MHRELTGLGKDRSAPDPQPHHHSHPGVQRRCGGDQGPEQVDRSVGSSVQG